MATQGAEPNNSEDVNGLTTERGNEILPAFAQSRTSEPEPGISMPTVMKPDQVARVRSSEPLTILQSKGEMVSPRLSRNISSNSDTSNANETQKGTGSPRASM
ncbi:MAG: hypothetical protein AB7I18_08990 [Candidatus Berkiella sp.]